MVASYRPLRPGPACSMRAGRRRSRLSRQRSMPGSRRVAQPRCSSSPAAPDCSRVVSLRVSRASPQSTRRLKYSRSIADALPQRTSSTCRPTYSRGVRRSALTQCSSASGCRTFPILALMHSGVTSPRRSAPVADVYLIDSAFDPSSTAKDHVLPSPESGIATRKLNDGREFRIIKRFWEPQALAARLGELGWRATIMQTPSYFIHGLVEPGA